MYSVVKRKVDDATRQDLMMKKKDLISNVMREMGRKGGKAGGSKGGKARMAALSPKERSENARRAARIRWTKAKTSIPPRGNKR